MTLAPDPYWSSVELLLDCEGADGSTAFTDRSSIGHVVTASGNAQVDTAVAIYGSASCLLDGTGDDLSLTTPALGSGSWAIETQARWSTLPGTGDYSCLFSLGNATDYGLLLWMQNSGGTRKLSLYVSSNGTSWGVSNATLGSKTSWSVDTNYPIAVSFDGSAYRVFVDGAVDITVNSSSVVCAQTRWRIGRHSTAFPAGFNGHLDEIRFTKGTARYTDTYTPQTAPFPLGGAALLSATSADDTAELLGTVALGDSQTVAPATGHLTFAGKTPVVAQVPPLPPWVFTPKNRTDVTLLTSVTELAVPATVLTRIGGFPPVAASNLTYP